MNALFLTNEMLSSFNKPTIGCACARHFEPRRGLRAPVRAPARPAHPIACGGGGIPVIENDKNYLVGVEAVIDKDIASSLLAIELKAELFVITTGLIGSQSTSVSQGRSG